MNECGCYDPGFILRLLLGEQNGRAVSIWFQNRLIDHTAGSKANALNEKDIVWMGSQPLPDGLTNQFSISQNHAEHLRVADLSLDGKGPQAYKSLLEQFLKMDQQQVRIAHLMFARPESEAEAGRIHMTIRLLRAVLLKLKSDMLLLPHNSGSGLEKGSFWGNTLNEAHLVYNDELPAMLAGALTHAPEIFTRWAARLTLPSLNVAYFNHIPGQLFEHAQRRMLAINIALTLSGLPAFDETMGDINVSELISLLAVRRTAPVFHPSGPQMVVETPAPVFALMRISPDASQFALCLHNLTENETEVPIDQDALGLYEQTWRDLITGNIYDLSAQSSIHLNGYASAWLVPAR